MRPDNDDICQEISLWAVRRGLPDPVNLPRSTRLRQKFAVAAARRQRNHVPIPSGPGSEPPSNAPTPAHEAIAAERRDVIVTAVLSRLTGRHQEVALLLLDGLGISEVAAQTGLTRRQIYNCLDYTKRKLRADASLRTLLN